MGRNTVRGWKKEEKVHQKYMMSSWNLKDKPEQSGDRKKGEAGS